MLQQIFTIFDMKAMAYINPFFLPNEAMAERSFADCCIDTNHEFGRHPEDYQLYHIGVFDMESSQIEYLGPRLIAKGNELQAIHQFNKREEEK